METLSFLNNDVNADLVNFHMCRFFGGGLVPKKLPSLTQIKGESDAYFYFDPIKAGFDMHAMRRMGCFPDLHHGTKRQQKDEVH